MTALPAAPPVARAWRTGLVAMLVVTATVLPIALSRIAFAALPLGSDQGLYITIGELIDRGGVPWRDAWENKPPGTYYLYAAVLAAAPDYADQCVLRGGPLPPGGMVVQCAQVALSFFDALYAVATAGAVWWIGRRVFGTGAGLVAAMLFGFFGSMSQVAQGGGVPDLHVLLPTALAYASGLRFVETAHRRWLFLAGAMAAGATLFKQTGGIHVVAIGAWLLVDAAMTQHTVRTVRARGLLAEGAALTLGAAVVFGATAAIFAALSTLADLLDQAIFWYRYYVGAPPAERGMLYLAISQSWKVFSQSQAGLWLAAVAALPIVPAGLRRDRRVGLVVAWALASTLSLALGGAHFHQYYYAALVPPFAVLGGWSLVSLWRNAHPAGRVWLVASFVAVALLAGQLQANVLLRAWNDRITSTATTPEEFISGDARGGQPGSIFVWGNGSQVYALSGRSPASRYLHTAAVSNDFAVNDQVARNRAELMSTLSARPPLYVAVDRPWLEERKTLDFPELRAFLEGGYTLVTRDDNPIYRGWQLYRRNM